jgi:hypothetical protein
LIAVGGVTLLNRFNGSQSELLANLYPDYEWLPWKFDVAPAHFWNDIKNQKKFMDWVGKQLKITEMSDWYKVTKRVTIATFPLTHYKDLYNVGASSLLNSNYNASPSQLLAAVYPDYEWLPWKFAHTPRNMWADSRNIKKFLDWAGKQLGIKNLDDWNKVVIEVSY